MEQIPFYVSGLFVATTLLAVYFLLKATSYSRATMVAVSIWLLLQAGLALQSFFLVTDTVPPRMMVLLAPPMVTIILLFATRGGRRFIDRLELRHLVLLHMVRIPVEVVLFWLCLYKTIPQVMTFEGRNFDIISGITAPVVYYFYFVRKQMSRSLLIAWNVMCLVLLLNVVIHGLLSAPGVLQRLSFDRPNIGILYFPFVWLPGFIVPLVLFAHLVSIRQVVIGKSVKERNIAVEETRVMLQS